MNPDVFGVLIRNWVRFNGEPIAMTLIIGSRCFAAIFSCAIVASLLAERDLPSRACWAGGLLAAPFAPLFVAYFAGKALLMLGSGFLILYRTFFPKQELPRARVIR